MSRESDMLLILRLSGTPKAAQCREQKKLNRKSARWLRGEVIRLKKLAETKPGTATSKMPDLSRSHSSFNDRRTDREEWAHSPE